MDPIPAGAPVLLALGVPAPALAREGRPVAPMPAGGFPTPPPPPPPPTSFFFLPPFLVGPAPRGSKAFGFFLRARSTERRGGQVDGVGGERERGWRGRDSATNNTLVRYAPRRARAHARDKRDIQGDRDREAARAIAENETESGSESESESESERERERERERGRRCF